MKKITISILTVAFAVSAFVYFSGNKETIKKYAGEAMESGNEDEEDSRKEWELLRLMDPATGKIPDNIRQIEIAFAATLPSDASINGKSAAINWESRGPWNVGGITRAFAIDVTDENVLFAGSGGGGVWRSADAGATWTETTTLAQHQAASCISQDKRAGKENIWYYGGGDAYASGGGGGSAYYLGNGLCKSTDGGLSWTPLSSTTSTQTGFNSIWDLVYCVEVDNSNTVSDVVYASTYGAVLRSVNGGTSWTAVRGSASLVGGLSYWTDVKVSPTGVVYATLSDDGSHKGIWRSADGLTYTKIQPITFTPAGTDTFPTSYKRIVTAIDPNDENVVYMLANTPGFGTPDTNFVGDVEWNSLWKYTYISGDGSGTGGTWTDLSASLPTTGGLFDKFQCQGSYDMVIKVKPGDPNTVFIGGTNLYRSTNAFADGSQTTFIGGYQQGATLPIVNMYANHHPDQHGLAFLPSNPDVMYSSNDGGVFRTDDNTAGTIVWNSLNNGYLTTMFYTTAIDHGSSNNDIIIGGTQDNGTWYTNSNIATNPWTTPRGGDGSFCAIADDGAAYYFSIQNGKVQKANVDASGNVLSYARIDPLGGKGYWFINPFTLDPNNNNIMYLAGGKYLWRNDDLSGIPMVNNWDSITTNWTQFPDSVPVAGAKITAIGVSKTPANMVYYGTSNKRVYRVDNANTGTPTPVDITPNSVVAFPAGGYVNCIATDPRDGNKAIVVFSNYSVQSMFYTTNAGSTWTKVAGNLESAPGPSCRWASILPVNGGASTVYLVGTSIGLFATDTLTSTTTTWVQQGANTIGNTVVDMIDVRESDGQVVVATHGHGIFSAKVSSVTSVKNLKDNSNSFGLGNYPNPFSDKTGIFFNLKNSSKVKLSILDEMGRVVRILADETMIAGAHYYEFKRENLSSGLYYCSLQAGEAVQTKKLIIY
jgi:hypothetical protein